MIKLPNLFILGAPKCGTTSFARYLDQHPEIFVSSFKEPHYFNTDSKHRFTFSEKQYLEYFKGASSSHKYLVDASVWYLFSDNAVENIMDYNPDAKFIVMLRDPTDMFFSLYQQFLFSGKETLSTPIKAWNWQKRRDEGKDVPLSCYDPNHLQYKKVCSLGDQVEKLLQTVPRSRVHFICFDDLKANPNGVYQKVLGFLNLRSFTLESYKVYNEKKERKSLWLAYTLKVLFRLKKKFKIRKGLGLANFIDRINRKEFSDKSKGEVAELKKILKMEFQEDQKKLKKIFLKDRSNESRVSLLNIKSRDSNSISLDKLLE